MKYCNPYQYAPIAVSCYFIPQYSRPKVSVPVNKIISIVCRYCEIERKAISGQSRERDNVEARQIAIRLIMSHVPQISLARIGYYFNRDHSTVIYSDKCVSNLLKTNKAFKSKFEFLEREVLASNIQ